MNFMQKFFVAILPKKWAESMEADSRTWTARCRQCGFKRSAWEAGCIRWKAWGEEVVYLFCPQCEKSRFHTIYRERTPDKPNTPHTNSE